MGRKVEGPRGPTGQAVDSAWKVAAQAETGRWSAARAAGCRRCASCCRFKRIRPGSRILGDVPGTSRSLCPSRGPSEGQAAHGASRRARCPERGAWGRGESSHRDRVAGFVMKPTSTSPGPSHVTSASCSSLCPSAGTPWGNRHRSLGVQAALAPRSWGAGGAGRRGHVGWPLWRGRGRGVPTPDAPVRQSGPRPGRGLGRKSRSGEGHMVAPPRPSEGSVCGVGPVARDCPHSVHVCEAAPSVPGTRRPAHLELTCLA